MATAVRKKLRLFRRYLTPFAGLNLGYMPRLSADSRGAIYPDLNIFYNRIPKAANTTVVGLLNEIRTGVVDDVDMIKDNTLRPSHLDWQQARAFRDLFKFTFVRNPFERTLSAWLQKVAPGETLGYAKIPGFGDTSATGFAAFVDFLANGGLHVNKHWAPQYTLLVIPPARFDFIGRVESFNQDMATVLSRTGFFLPDGRLLEERYPTDRDNRTDAKDKKRLYYTAREVEIVQRLFADDFRLLDYETNPSW